MFFVFTGENGVDYAFGTGNVVLRRGQDHPKYNEGGLASCNFSAEVERTNTGEKDDNGTAIYKTRLINFTAFSRLARLCRNFEQKDSFCFFGRLSVDEYWTKKNTNGEIQYKVTLDFVIPQFTEDMLFSQPQEEPDERDEEEEYYKDFYGGPGY